MAKKNTKRFGKKQTLTVCAPTAAGLARMVDFLTNAFADYKDSGEAPEQVYYRLGTVEVCIEEFE